MAVECLIQDWLTEYKQLAPEEVVSYASTLDANEEVTTCVFRVLEDRIKYADLIEPVVGQLYSYYQSQCRKLQCYTLQFLPSLVFVCLNCVAHGDKQSCPTVETLLLGMYNQELLDRNGRPRVLSFRLPSLAQASPYHDPMSLAPASLTESALRRLEECNTHLVMKGPYHPVAKLVAQNRLAVLSALLVIYNGQLSAVPDHATPFLCKAVSRLVTQGFSKQASHQRSSYDSSLVPPTLPRIPVNAEFLLELLTAVHPALYSDACQLATQSLEDVHFRAAHELLPDVMLVTNALRNILHISAAAPLPEGVVASNMSPVMNMPKSLITNASFRTKKLPDDIPIQDKREDGEAKMESISEEGVEGKAKGGLKAVVKLPSLVKKKAAEAARPKTARRKTEPTEEVEEVAFAPENSQGGSEQAEELELKQRDSVV